MTWVLDPSHSSVEFSAKHMMFTTVRGRAGRYTATLDLDEEQPQRSSVEVVIEADSLATGEPSRDGHLRSPDFFDVEKYPTIAFRGTRVEPAGGGRYRLTGDLTIKDVTRPVTLDVSSEGYGKDPWGNRRWALNAATTLSRKDFDLNWNVALEAGGWLVSDEVKIAIELQAIQQVAKAEEAA